MKHISSKLILLTILLVASLISLSAFWSVQILRKESKAYTFQNQQLQTRILAKDFQLEVISAQELAAHIFALRTNREALPAAVNDQLLLTQRGNGAVKGVGIYVKNESGTWVESPQNSISAAFTGKAELIRNLTQTFVLYDPAQSEDRFILFPSETALIAVRLNLNSVQAECQGLPVGIFNRNGQNILFCDPAIATWMGQSPGALKNALDSHFQSGSFERTENNHSGLWGYADLDSWGKVVSVIDIASAYRSSYLLGIRVVLMVLMSLGVAIVASILVARKVTDPIIEVSEATQKIANGDFDTHIVVKTKDETHTLAESVNAMAQKIKHLIISEVEKTKLDAQLEVAGEVQRTLIPESKIEITPFVITSFYRPADQCGGDWWGYVRGKNKLAVLVGDVTGHGYPSALLVATTRGYISMLQDQVERVGEIDYSPTEMLKILNRVVFEATLGELNMTAMCVILEMDSGKFTLASAGHNAAYLLKATTSEIKSLNAEGARLGEANEIQANLTENSGVIAGHGEKLILYTDGIQDLGSEENPLGRKGFRKFLQEKMQAVGDDIVSAVESELVPLNEGRPLIDDITFLVLERKP
jgi:serine phosphatase RsbU (regulator of sigma subunit)